MYIFSISLSEYCFVNSEIEKCSESIGINSVLYLDAVFFIKFQPQTIDSLFAKRIFLLNFIKVSVGSRPARPGIAETLMSIFFIYLFKLIVLFKIFIFLYLFFFFNF